MITIYRAHDQNYQTYRGYRNVKTKKMEFRNALTRSMRVSLNMNINDLPIPPGNGRIRESGEIGLQLYDLQLHVARLKPLRPTHLLKSLLRKHQRCIGKGGNGEKKDRITRAKRIYIQNHVNKQIGEVSSLSPLCELEWASS